jgi:hypothetical protein
MKKNKFMIGLAFSVATIAAFTPSLLAAASKRVLVSNAFAPFPNCNTQITCNGGSTACGYTTSACVTTVGQQ